MIDQLDQEIIDALERIMDRTPSSGPTPSEIVVWSDSRPSRRPVLVAAGAIAIAGSIAIGVVVTQRTDHTPQQPFASDPASAASSTPTSSAPLSTPVVTPPATELTLFPTIGGVARSGDFGSYSEPAKENPERVTALLARRNGSVLVDGIRIEAVGPGLDFIGWSVESVVVHGVAAQMYTDNSLGAPIIRSVVLPGDPAVVVTGTDPVGFLESADPGAIGAALVSEPAPGQPFFTLSFGTLPAGYEVVVAPFRSPFGAAEAAIYVNNTETSNGSIDANGSMVAVSLLNPLPAYAMLGTLTQIEVNGVSGWWLISAVETVVIWEPAPGIFATAGGSGVKPADEALAFAESVIFVSEAEWRQIYTTVSSG